MTNSVDDKVIPVDLGMRPTKPVLLTQVDCPSCEVIKVLLRNLSIDYTEVVIIKLDDDDNPTVQPDETHAPSTTAIGIARSLRKQGIGFPTMMHGAQVKVIGNSERILMSVLEELGILHRAGQSQPFDHAGI